MEDTSEFNSLTAGETRGSYVYESLSYKLIKCTLDAMPGKAIIISTAGKPAMIMKMFMPLEFQLVENDIQNAYEIHFTAESMTEEYIAADSFKIECCGDNAVPNKAAVYFDVANGHSQFPSLAFKLITKALPSSFTQRYNCNEISTYRNSSSAMILVMKPSHLQPKIIFCTVSTTICAICPLPKCRRKMGHWLDACQYSRAPLPKITRRNVLTWVYTTCKCFDS